MAGDAALAAAVRADQLALLDEQVANLSERVFELGRSADRQLAVWLGFAALTVLFAFGLTEQAAVAGLELDTNVATALAYGLSCLVYYRHAVTDAALGLWRSALRERRRLRYGLLLETGGATVDDVSVLIREYPGYVAASVVLKDEAAAYGNAAARYVRCLHYAVIAGRLLAPYGLAAVVLVSLELTPAAIAVVVAGIALTLSGNAVASYRGGA